MESPIPIEDLVCRKKLELLGVIVGASDKCTYIGDIIERLAKGTYVFNKPKTAYVGEMFKLLLVLKTAPEQDVSPYFLGLAGAVKEVKGEIAQSLEAQLTGDDFDVKPQGPQPRTATMTRPVEWQWTLKPTAGGTKTLTVEVTANIQIGKDKHNVQLTTLHEDIVIEVSPFQRIQAYLATASGLAVAIAATIPPLAVIIKFWPKVRTFFVGICQRRKQPNGAARRGTRRA